MLQSKYIFLLFKSYCSCH